ncbi:hypothetical protein Tco_1418951 [Tanacetum coccineum]
MSNILEDIQCAGSDTRPPMLDRTDFASWQQYIRLYCQGKENGVNILNSIDEGPFQMGTFRETLAEGNKGALHLGSETNQEDRESQLYDDFKHFRQNKGETIHDYYVQFSKLINDMRNIKMTMSRMQLNSKFVNNMLPKWGRFVTVVKLNRGLKDSNYDQLPIAKKTTLNPSDKDLESSRQDVAHASHENGVHWMKSSVVYSDDCDAFDSDVDEAPTAQTMFMANLSSADPVYDEASPSYDLDILSEVPDHDNYLDTICEHHEEHKMHDKVQPNYVVDLYVDYMSDSNMILYDQYVKENTVPVVQSVVSSVPNDAYMMILNDMHEQSAKCVSMTTQNNVVDKPLTAKLAT